jgi:hypothetical protein
MKLLRGWEWENFWLCYALCGTILLPWALVGLTIPSFVEVYSGAPWRDVGLCALFGFGWGVGSVLFGICIDLLGSAVTFSVVLGLTSCIGSLTPFIIQHPDELRSTQALLNYGAVTLVLVGLVFIAAAGIVKDKQQADAARAIEVAMAASDNLSVITRQELRSIAGETTALTRTLAARARGSAPLSAATVSRIIDEALGLLRQAADIAVELDRAEAVRVSSQSYGLGDAYAPSPVGGARTGVVNYDEDGGGRGSGLDRRLLLAKAGGGELSVWGRDADEVERDAAARAAAASCSGCCDGGCGSPAAVSALGIVLAVASGCLSACINGPLAFATAIPARARRYNASKLMAPNTVWALAVSFGMLPQALYCIVLLCRNGTWRNFCRACAPARFSGGGGRRGRGDELRDASALAPASALALFCSDLCNALCALTSGALWFGSNIFYSVGAEKMGEHGEFILYRYISGESFSQFDSLPLTSLPIFRPRAGLRDLHLRHDRRSQHLWTHYRRVAPHGVVDESGAGCWSALHMRRDRDACSCRVLRRESCGDERSDDRPDKCAAVNALRSASHAIFCFSPHGGVERHT